MLSQGDAMVSRIRLLEWIKRSPFRAPAEYLHERRWHRRSLRQGTFAQHGEDRFVIDYFGGKSGTYVDVGANHPFQISNTYLLYLGGWRGVTIEPLYHLYQKHRRMRPLDVQLNVAA